METLFIETSKPGWVTRTEVPLLLSLADLEQRKRLPRARGPWALDSGSYAQLSTCVDGCIKIPGSYDRHTGIPGPTTYKHLAHKLDTTPSELVDAVRLYQAAVGGLQWVTPQDWPCSPAMLAMTHRSLLEHQRLTVESYCQLTTLAPDVPFIPVIQGWGLADYEFCLALYSGHGVDLATLPLVGVGSTSQSQHDLAEILRWLHGQGLRLHIFNAPQRTLQRCSRYLASASSAEWRVGARKNPLPGHTHKSCAECMDFAVAWRADAMKRLAHHQMSLGF